MSDMTFQLAEQLPMKGVQRGRGWAYMGNDSRAFTNESTQRLISYFEQHDYPHLVTAAGTFLRTCGREGFISAINTWDGQILTWGTGFAYHKINQAIWPNLSQDTRNELQFLVPSRFGGGGVTVDQAVRTDTHTLAALIYVAETPPFRDSVFRAMFNAFIAGTLGIDLVNIPQGQHYIVSNPSLVYFASRLAHWLPAGYSMRTDLPRTMRLAHVSGTNASVDATQFVAASIRVFAENFLRPDSYGETRDGNRRVLKEAVGDRFNMIAKWQNRMSQFVRQDVPFTITGTVQNLVPAFTQPTSPFFTIHNDWRAIPPGRLILSEGKPNGDLYIDIGPR